MASFARASLNLINPAIGTIPPIAKGSRRAISIARLAPWEKPIRKIFFGENPSDLISLNNALNLNIENTFLEEVILGGNYVDINTNSDYFDQLIGPDTFNGNVALYYFGKAG